MNRFGLVACMLALAGGCSSSKELIPITDRIGFLRHYALMRAGAETEPLYVYRNPSANLGIFEHVILEPIKFWRGEESRTAAAPKESVQHVADYFYTLLHERLARDYEMVTEPGPEVLRVRVAVTKLEEKETQLDVKSTDKPETGLARQFEKLTQTPPGFVGRASIEIELVDTQSNEVQFAAIERRSARADGGEIVSWNDLEEYLEFTVERIAYRLCMERGEEACFQPPDPFAPVQQGG